MEFSREKLLGSLLLFTRVFFELRTGRKFIMPSPIGRENHCITICRELTSVFRGDKKFLGIQIPPRYGKTELCIHFIPWCLAHYPDSQFIYLSYSHDIAATQTAYIREIIMMKEYKELFGIELKSDSKAKDMFQTTAGGRVSAVGSGGSVTGKGAGIYGTDRFGGCIVIDDIIKPDEATSDTIRVGTNDWYLNTLLSRQNSPDTPILCIGQRTHEDDLIASLKKCYDGNNWEFVTLKALDDAGNVLDPARHSKERIMTMMEKFPYVTSAQYQQEPQPAGGGIFKPEWFVQLDSDPEMIATFITGDTAETDKTYNDATVFSFWGIYRIKNFDIETDLIGLHLIDFVEDRVQPKDLEDLFMTFLRSCMTYSKKPVLIGVENESTGVTLNSALTKIRGITLLPIKRNRSKTQRFIGTQGFITSGFVSVNKFKKNTPIFLEHMRKITANNTHMNDDICDTFSDAVQLALVEKTIQNFSARTQDSSNVLNNMISEMDRLNILERMRFNGGY